MCVMYKVRFNIVIFQLPRKVRDIFKISKVLSAIKRNFREGFTLSHKRNLRLMIQRVYDQLYNTKHQIQLRGAYVNLNGPTQLFLGPSP